MNFSSFVSTINAWSSEKIPFLFIIDFEGEKPLAYKLKDIQENEILFAINGVTNSIKKDFSSSEPIRLEVTERLSEEDYYKKFCLVMDGLKRGDSFLTNLTIKTKVRSNLGLNELFKRSRAPYKLLFKNEFLVFSPEPFIKIKEGKVFAYPMKGTIDASIPDASIVLMNDQKEMAEHMTIVDLIRNDLSRVAKNVEVKRLRYIEEIVTNNKKLLQTSSEIWGDLSKHFQNNIGDLLAALLPAGSVSGAPKTKTLEIIEKAEMEKRGYYTGVFGYFDGCNLDSAVMIRFIENCEGEYYYRSGGGITAQSEMKKEYEEALNKVYVPVN